MAKQNNKEKKGKPVARAVAKFETFTVKEPAELLEFLMKAKDGISRNAAKSFLSKRQIYVDHVITTQYNFPLKSGMKVQINKEGKKEFQSNQIKILYEDAYLLVVDKKEGILTTTGKQKERSAHSILEEYVQRSGKQRRVYAVHHMDREVSGILIFAKDEKTKITLQDNWNKTIKRYQYVAILSGETEKDNGVVTSWLLDGRLYFSHSPLSNNDGNKAVTYYKTIKRANDFSMVELDLSESKKNQARAHMHELKHPIVGDEKFESESNPIKRLALHAFRLHFHHPVTGDLMKFETPYPVVFRKLVQKEAASQTK
ncbi:RluA family pseudouridine synthase [Bacteroides sp. 224]|uniref:RluA family pseudouridine synthase n=1 Tax=Bacteroides sp. 224 TaxID=2302936 RepID=UPI0013D50FB1|nr:RluA family pseudouridine synthase [Bacteroides sp. 224]NDV65993.1 RluA family pseudouridine synthase [Bacteroides sp. 224]